MNEFMMPLKLESCVWMFRQYCQHPRTKTWQAILSFNCHDSKTGSDVDNHKHFIKCVSDLKMETKEKLHNEIERLYSLYITK